MNIIKLVLNILTMTIENSNTITHNGTTSDVDETNHIYCKINIVRHNTKIKWLIAMKTGGIVNWINDDATPLTDQHRCYSAFIVINRGTGQAICGSRSREQFDHYKNTNTSTNTALFLMDSSNNNTKWFICVLHCFINNKFSPKTTKIMSYILDHNEKMDNTYYNTHHNWTSNLFLWQ